MSEATSPEDDFEFEIVELDSSPNHASERVTRPFHFSPGTRAWLNILTGLASILLLFLVFHNIFSFSLPSPLPVTPPAKDPSSVIHDVTLANGIAYVTSSDGTLHALRAITGTQLWQYTPPIAAHATVEKGIVYLEAHNGQTGFVRALRASDGALLWSRSTAPLGFDPLLVDGEMVYPNSEVITQGRSLSALRASDGLPLWLSTLNTPGLVTPGAAYLQIMQGNIYITAQFGTNNPNAVLYVLRARDGVKLWTYTYASNEDSSTPPTVERGLVYIKARDGSVKALRSTDGAQLWLYSPRHRALWDAVVHNGVVYVSDAVNTIIALNANDGSPLWTYNDTRVVISISQETDGIIYLKTIDGAITALRTDNGTRLWHYRLPSKVTSGLSLAIDGIAYLYSKQRGGSNLQPNQTVYALRISDGTFLWLHAYAGFTPLRVLDGVAYIEEGDHVVAALQVSTGSVLWRTGIFSRNAWLLAAMGGIVYIASDHGTLDVRQAQNGKVLWHYPT